MALVTQFILAVHDNDVYIAFEVEDTTNRLTAILYYNKFTNPNDAAEVEVEHPQFGTLRRVLAANQSTERRVEIAQQNQPSLTGVIIRTAWPALGP